MSLNRNGETELYCSYPVSGGRYSTTLQVYEEGTILKPGWSSGSAARLHKRKCSQAVQRKCSQAVVLPFRYKRRELRYSLAVQAEVQPGLYKRKCS